MAVLSFDASPLAEPSLVALALRLVPGRPDHRPTRYGEVASVRDELVRDRAPPHTPQP